MNSHLLQLYGCLPEAMRQFCVRVAGMTPIRWRFGQEFFRRLDRIEHRQWWTRAELEEYQNDRLRWMTAHAYENVPYYREVFDQRRLKPADIRTIEDLPKLPILTKDIVRSRAQDLWARNIPSSQTAQAGTSGTTGRTVKIRTLLANEFPFGGPYEWRFYRCGGYEPGARCAVFRAQFITGNDHQICKFNRAQNKIYFSIYHLRSETVSSYAAALTRWAPPFVNAYP